MRSKITTKRGSQKPRFIQFIQDNWLFLLAVLFVLPYILKMIREVINSMKENAIKLKVENSNVENAQWIPQTIEEKLYKLLFMKYKISDKKIRERLSASTLSIVNDLGIKYSDDSSQWYQITDIRGWTENDKSIGDTLVREGHNYKFLEQIYYNVYTQSRNLSADLLKYLDKDQIERVRRAHKSIGKYHF
jgi:hypothetical protein